MFSIHLSLPLQQTLSIVAGFKPFNRKKNGKITIFSQVWGEHEHLKTKGYTPEV